MKTSILFLVSCLLVLSPSFAQNGYQVRVGSGYNLNYQPYLQQSFNRFPNQAFTVTQHLEALYYKNTKRNGRLYAGIGYERTPYLYKNLIMFMPAMDAMTIAPTELLSTSKSVEHFIYVPIRYQHFLGKKKNIILGANFAQQFALFSHTKNTFEIINGTGTRIVHNYNFMFSASAALQLESGYRFRIHDKYELLAVAYVKAQGNPFDLRFFGYTLQPGISLSFSLPNS